MPKRVTIAEVATLAGVHKATVSRALNANTEHQVNAATAKRIQRAAKQLGYIPNIMARGLRTSLSMTVGVIVPDLTNPIFPPILRGIENYLSPRGYTALIANTDGRESVERAAFESLLERRVDGFIMATGLAVHPLLDDAYRREVRAVMVNRRADEVPYPLVTGDDNAGITAAVTHLAHLGHREILHIAGPLEFSTSVVRAEAFTAACNSHRGVHSRVITASALSVEAGQSSMDSVLMARTASPTAVVAGNDLVALGVMRSLRAHGLHCPDDVSVVGFNDMPFAEDFQPALTTVRIPHLQLGAEAARLLLAGLTANAQTPITITLPVSLIVRESTAAPRRR
jgi:LacI family transcriptional regulator